MGCIGRNRACLRSGKGSEQLDRDVFTELGVLGKEGGLGDCWGAGSLEMGVTCVVTEKMETVSLKLEKR